MDRLKGLIVFIRVVEAGGFSAAAKRLNISPTMVSKNIQNLEERLGTRLLERTTRKVDLTEIGKDYYQRGKQILNDLEQADAAASAVQAMPRGVLRVYVASQLSAFVSPVVSDYLTRYRQTQIDLIAGVREVDLIDEGIDLAIRLTAPADSSMMVRKLATWQHVVCAAPAYLAEKSLPGSPVELEAHNCLRDVLHPHLNEWHFTDRKGVQSIARVTGNLVTNSGSALYTAALQGQGVFLAPTFMVAKDIEAGRLVRLLDDFTPADMTVSAVYPHRHHISAKVRSFIDLLVAHCEDHRRLLETWT